MAAMSRPFRMAMAAALVLGLTGLSHAAGPNPGDNPTKLKGPALRGVLEFYPNGHLSFTGTCTNVPFALNNLQVPSGLYDDVQDDRDFAGSSVKVSLFLIPEECWPRNVDPATTNYLTIVSAWAGQIVDFGMPSEHWQANIVAMYYLET